MLREDRACRRLRLTARVRLPRHRTENSSISTIKNQRSIIARLLFRYLGLALKYRWLIIACCTVALAIGFFVTFTSTPIYRATVSIQIDRQAPRIVKTDTQPDFGDDSDRFYQTQFDLLQSRMLAERVASDLNLGSASDFLDPPSTSPWRKLRSLILPSANTGTASEDKGNDAGISSREKLPRRVWFEGGLSIDPEKDSNLVRISFDSPSAEWAARIANGVADSYVTSNLERRYGATAYARNFLKERLDELKLKLEESEKALVAYAEDKELIGDVKAVSKDGKEFGAVVGRFRFGSA